jgi:hypothetical protein
VMVVTDGRRVTVDNEKMWDTPAISCLPRLNLTAMRYWSDGADEDYAREEAQMRGNGMAGPAPISVCEVSTIAVLVAGEILLWLALAVAAAVRLFR